MPLTYFDSSALVKRYLPELGSAWVTRLCKQEPVAISLVTIPEIASALARRTREGALTTQQREALFQALLGDARSFTVVEPKQAIAQEAATLLLTAPAPV
ncbi:MAG TPA: type II toxin-antitoxin system VapC family toxin, partial [Chloroflexota bacterium]|nr:type II toxin-antitoxin system VapC family toxin [Chloroflexota bacterium]